MNMQNNFYADHNFLSIKYALRTVPFTPCTILRFFLSPAKHVFKPLCVDVSLAQSVYNEMCLQRSVSPAAGVQMLTSLQNQVK